MSRKTRTLTFAGIGALVLAAAATSAFVYYDGRVSTDEKRIGRVGEDRRLPAAELFDRIASESRAVESTLASISPADQDRTGVHVRLGEMAIPAIFERFVVSHLEEHVVQLREVVAPA